MVAKTLAYAGGVKVKGVPTFQVLADQVAVEDRKLIVVSDAQRGDVFMQEYHGESGNWRAASSLSIMNWNRLIEANRPGTSGEALITGPGLHRFQITEECTLKKTVTEDWLPTAGQTILSGLRETESAAYDDAIQLGPIYVRASAAEEKLGLGA
jgi:tRNA threonylcarbamoyladenosine biosynthesis protein TsaB